MKKKPVELRLVTHEIDFNVDCLRFCNCKDSPNKDMVRFSLNISPDVSKKQFFEVMKAVESNLGKFKPGTDYEIIIRRVKAKRKRL